MFSRKSISRGEPTLAENSQEKKYWLLKSKIKARIYSTSESTFDLMMTALNCSTQYLSNFQFFEKKIASTAKKNRLRKN